MSLTPTKNETLKLHYIISNLKSLSHKKIILISALDYDILPAESRAFIDVLLCNKCFIEEKVKKNITVILTSTHDYFDGKYKIINAIFNDYNYKDIYASKFVFLFSLKYRKQFGIFHIFLIIYFPTALRHIFSQLHFFRETEKSQMIP